MILMIIIIIILLLLLLVNNNNNNNNIIRDISPKITSIGEYAMERKRTVKKMSCFSFEER